MSRWSEKSTALPSRRHAPPDYSSRGVKFRLFITLGSIMLVAALIERTWTRNKHHAPPPSEPFNNRLNAEPRTTHDAAGTFVAASDAKSNATATTEPLDPLQRTWRQAWKHVLSQLSGDEKSLLFEVLYLNAIGARIPAEKEASAIDLVREVSRAWDQFQATAAESVRELKAEEQAPWLDVLRRVSDHFSRDILPALKGMTGNPDPNVGETTSQPELLETLASLDRLSIQDDTPILRPAERDIWFFEMGRVLYLSELSSVIGGGRPQLEQAKPPAVTYLQMSRQPADYRGKLVTIKGNVRRAYRSAATANYLGVNEYCVYWLYPAGGPDTPIVVYALKAPPGFPKLAKNAQEARNNFREDVEITGIFFKRCAYAAQGGTYTAPLILASAPVWHPAPPPFAAVASPNLIYELGGAVLVALVIAMCVTSVLWKRSSSRRARPHSLSDASLVDLSKLTTSPTTADHLRQLENKEGGSK